MGSSRCGGKGSIPGPAQWNKDVALLRLQCRQQLWLGFNPWPRNFPMLPVQQQKKKEKKRIAKNFHTNWFRSIIWTLCLHRNLFLELWYLITSPSQAERLLWGRRSWVSLQLPMVAVTCCHVPGSHLLTEECWIQIQTMEMLQKCTHENKNKNPTEIPWG